MFSLIAPQKEPALPAPRPRTPGLQTGREYGSAVSAAATEALCQWPQAPSQNQKHPGRLFSSASPRVTRQDFRAQSQGQDAEPPVQTGRWGCCSPVNSGSVGLGTELSHDHVLPRDAGAAGPRISPRTARHRSLSVTGPTSAWSASHMAPSLWAWRMEGAAARQGAGASEAGEGKGTDKALLHPNLDLSPARPCQISEGRAGVATCLAFPKVPPASAGKGVGHLAQYEIGMQFFSFFPFIFIHMDKYLSCPTSFLWPLCSAPSVSLVSCLCATWTVTVDSGLWTLASGASQLLLVVCSSINVRISIEISSGISTESLTWCGEI